MTNLIYHVPATTLWFVPAAAAQAEDSAFEMHNIATTVGRQSAQQDLGAAARASLFEWRAWVQFATAPVLGEIVQFWIKTSDGNYPDNDDGTGEGALSALDKTRNLHYIGAIQVDQTTANIEMVASGLVEIRARYVNIVMYNATADALTNDVDENGFSLTAVPDQIQDTV